MKHSTVYNSIHNSLFVRMLCAFWAALVRWWPDALFCRFGLWLAACYEHSAIKRMLYSVGGNTMGGRIYPRIMTSIGSLLAVCGGSFRQSLFYRVCMAVSALWRRLAAKSRLFSLISKLSLRQWMLVAFAMYLPLEFLLRDTFHLGIISSLWEELLMVAAFTMVVWERALAEKGSFKRETALDLWLLLFFAVGFFLMSMVAEYPSVALAGYRIVVQYMLWYFIIIRLIREEKDFRILWFSLAALITVLAFHGIYQYIIGVEIPTTWTTRTESSVRTRVFSITGSPNILGCMYTMMAPLVAAGIYYFRRTWQKLAALVLTVCIILALLFTYSRGAWVGMIVSVLIFAMFVDKRLIALMGAAMGAVLVAVPSITARITFLFSPEYTAASSASGRMMRWATGMEMVREHPWFGVGLGRFGGAVAMENQVWLQTKTFRYFYMDNYYLKTLVEMGTVGFAAYVLLLLALLYLGFKAVLLSDKPLRYTAGDPLTRSVGNLRVPAVAIFAGMCGALTHCYFENIFEEPYMSAYFWGMAALLFWLGFFREKSTDDGQ